MNTRKYQFHFSASNGERSDIFLHWDEVVARVADFIRSGDYTTDTRQRRVNSISNATGEIWVTSDWSSPGSIAGISGNDTHEALAAAIPWAE